MRTLTGMWITARALAAWLSGRIDETECRRRVNDARALVDQGPV